MQTGITAAVYTNNASELNAANGLALAESWEPLLIYKGHTAFIRAKSHGTDYHHKKKRSNRFAEH